MKSIDGSKDALCVNRLECARYLILGNWFERLSMHFCFCAIITYCKGVWSFTCILRKLDKLDAKTAWLNFGWNSRVGSLKISKMEKSLVASRLMTDKAHLTFQFTRVKKQSPSSKQTGLVKCTSSLVFHVRIWTYET